MATGSNWFDQRRANDVYWALTGKGRNSRTNERPQEYAGERDRDDQDR